MNCVKAKEGSINAARQVPCRVSQRTTCWSSDAEISNHGISLFQVILLTLSVWYTSLCASTVPWQKKSTVGLLNLTYRILLQVADVHTVIEATDSELSLDDWMPLHT